MKNLPGYIEPPQNASCLRCSDSVSSTYFCDNCAQQIIRALMRITPEPPKAITWENGVAILNELQDQLYRYKIGSESENLL